jgi:hypothetical protein
LQAIFWKEWAVFCGTVVAHILGVGALELMIPGSDENSALGAKKGERGNVMLWTIFAILLVLWLVGLIGGIGGGLIHLLLVVAAIVLIFNLLAGRRAVL